MVTFCENHGHRCNLDDPNWFVSRDTLESTNTNYLSYPRVSKVKNEAWEQTSIE